MSFRWKLFFSHSLLAILMVVALYLQLSRLLEGHLIENSRNLLMNEARLARLLYSNMAKHSSQKIAEQLGSATNTRVTLIAHDGSLTGDSDLRGDQISNLENHINRPEIQQAIATGIGYSIRYSDTLRVTMLYVAVADQLTDGTVIRLSLPLESLNAARQSLHMILVVTAAILLLPAILLSILLSNLVSRPLRSITEAAARLGTDQKRVNIPISGRDEINRLGQVLNDMADRLEEQIENLASERQRLKAILHGMGEGVIVLDSAGIITLVNPAFHKQISVDGDLSGKALVEVCRHPDLLNAYQRQRESGSDLVSEVALSGGHTVLSAHWVSLGKDHGTVAVFHDISDLKRTEAIRRDFVANVSHELRTPVTVIRGYAETLLDDDNNSLPEHLRQFISIIADHAKRLSGVINDILTLSRLESRETRLNSKTVDLAATVQKTATLLEEYARDKGVTLFVKCPSILPETVADQGLLEQMLLNLLDNAIKYTQPLGSVTVNVAMAGSDIQIQVMDTGLGIPQKDLPRIFERFYRVDEARTREQGGTGLGLAIVKHIVQLHGGEISVTSETGRGSCFVVRLPVQK